MTRAAAYIRVSKEKEGAVSPDFQRAEIQSFCERKGWTVAEWFEDLDISGRTDKRPALQDMIRRAVDGEFEAVVLYRIDRLSREPMHHYAILATLAEAGVEVDSVGLPSDGSPENAFMWDLSAALAKLESLRLGKRLRSMHAQIARDGKACGRIPFGFQRVRDDDRQQRLVADPEEAPWVRQMHRWFQAGRSLGEISRLLNERGVQTKGGNLWTRPLVTALLGNPAQVGIRRHKGQQYRTGRIEPLIDEETYQRTLALLEARRPSQAIGRPSVRPIPSGLLRCGSCGHTMFAVTLHRRQGRQAYYYCGAKINGRACPRGASIRLETLTAEIEPALLEQLKRVSVRAGRKAAEAPDISPLRAEAEALEVSLARLAALYSEGTITESEYRRATDMQRRKLDGAQERLRKAVAALDRSTLGSALGGALMTPVRWAVLPAEAKQEIYRLAVESVTVFPRPAEDRVVIVWR